MDIERGRDALLVASSPAMFSVQLAYVIRRTDRTVALGQLTWLYVQAVFTPSQELLGVPPTKWSFSSAVKTNNVLLELIPRSIVV